MDFKRKLTSRKFWLAIIGFVTPIMTMYNVPSETITQVTAIIMAGATLIAYILAEGFTDANATNVTFELPTELTEDGSLGDLIGDIEEGEE